LRVEQQNPAGGGGKREQIAAQRNLRTQAIERDAEQKAQHAERTRWRIIHRREFVPKSRIGCQRNREENREAHEPARPRNHPADRKGRNDEIALKLERHRPKLKVDVAAGRHGLENARQLVVDVAKNVPEVGAEFRRRKIFRQRKRRHRRPDQ